MTLPLRSVALLMLFSAECLPFAPAADTTEDYPACHLRGGDLDLEVMLPDAQRGYHR